MTLVYEVELASALVLRLTCLLVSSLGFVLFVLTVPSLRFVLFGSVLSLLALTLVPVLPSEIYLLCQSNVLPLSFFQSALV